jgi:hypothetical protein
VSPLRILLADDHDAVLAEVREELGADWNHRHRNERPEYRGSVPVFNPDVVPIFDGIEASERSPGSE